ncbi:radial spoke head 14 homolog isoform X1 [Bos indicus x Bos taurus]|uniref:radial spoke head 14 homolog isoform X1 n=1 Tax=Bos indicus x Bos taurus TaxID=30522 RepID=UPI000F7D28F9|nr:radial spoke head 14 homolog isoform X1 [Bos indicus x Bos taurus]XP_027421939.1 radial spoke head 14 homolog isoform X1 [Bos indicus x Bos taurus]
MADAKISMYLPPNVNPTQAAIAYGCRALPKLNEELQSDDLLTRQKALMALCDLMHDPEHVYTAISIGCLESLKALLKDTNDLVRIKTTEVLCIMATHNVGREGFLEHNVIQALSFLMSDAQPACRENLYTAFKHLAQLPAGALGIVNSGLIPSLVWKLQREEEEIQVLLLDTLAACLTEDATEALASRAVPFLKEKLLSTNCDIRSKAARTLIAVSVPPEGKIQVWQHDVIPILVHLLKDRDEEVQANAAGALMNATVTTEGKYAALDAEATRPLLQLLTSSLSKARLNAIKALTMLAEAPEGRKLLQPHVATFRALEEDFSLAVQRAAQIAIRVIEWKP